MNAKRRELTFQSLSDVMPEVDRLLEKGYTSAGTWSLGQICQHLASAIQGSVEGFDYKAPWPLRKIVAPFILRNLLKTRKMPEGIKVPKSMLPGPEHDDRAEAEALRAAIAYYQGHAEPLAEHPFFGKLNRTDWTNLHAIHAAHHLSFVLPA